MMIRMMIDTIVYLYGKNSFLLYFACAFPIMSSDNLHTPCGQCSRGLQFLIIVSAAACTTVSVMKAMMDDG